MVTLTWKVLICVIPWRPSLCEASCINGPDSSCRSLSGASLLQTTMKRGSIRESVVRRLDIEPWGNTLTAEHDWSTSTQYSLKGDGANLLSAWPAMAMMAGAFLILIMGTAGCISLSPLGGSKESSINACGTVTRPEQVPAAKKKDPEEVAAVRYKGFCSMGVSYVFLCCFFWLNVGRLRHLVVPFRMEVLYLVPGMMAGRWLMFYPITLLNWGLCRLWLGMDTQTYTEISRERAFWQGGEIEGLMAKYGERRIKILDATCRRISHVTQDLYKLFFYVEVARSLPLMFQLALYQLIGNQCLAFLLEGNTGVLGNTMFANVRMRDGCLGRFNLINVSFWGFVGFIISFMLLELRFPSGTQADKRTIRMLLILSRQCVVWGDAFAEIVGSFLGRLEFPVWGFGEINKKTVEGVFACWLASFAPIFYQLNAIQLEVEFAYSSAFVAMLTAFLGTIFEVVSPRATDNATIQISCLITLLLCMKGHSE